MGRQDGYYRSGSYVIEKMCQEIPYGILGSIGFALITYFAIGLKMTPYAFFFYTLCSFTVNVISTAISFGVASNVHVEFLPQVIIHVWTTLLHLLPAVDVGGAHAQPVRTTVGRGQNQGGL